mmetsp:Transcript_6878/g.12151  ORF Transcript_6878/g.12151 Transcript_6878/m.12151 type:complete len:186 (-) Transcript_6878:30-587(-)
MAQLSDCGLFGFELGDDCSSKINNDSKKLTKAGKSIVIPPGMVSGNQVVESADPAEVAKLQKSLKQRQMMDVAKAPGKQLMMTGLMLWMSGAGMNIFSIMMTGMALTTPLKAIFGMGTTFEQFKEVSGLLQAKLMFIALNGVGLAFAMYKLGQMGLLPLNSSDWISLLTVREPQELVGGISTISS